MITLTPSRKGRAPNDLLIFGQHVMIYILYHYDYRFKTFYDESMPVVERLSRLGKVRRISSVPLPSVVFSQVRRIFEVSRLFHTWNWKGGKGLGLDAIDTSSIPLSLMIVV